MSFPTHQPETPERETGWIKKTIESITTGYKQRKAVGLQWLLLAAAVSFVSAAYDAWFLGVLALAWHHIVPTIKWYYSVGTNPDGTKRKRNLRWNFGRFAIFAVTAGLFAWLWIDEGFAMAVTLPVLFGISIPLWKRDWTMLGAIWFGAISFAFFTNGASLAAAVILSAVIKYERRKAVYAAEQARKDNLFEERNPWRSVPQPAPAAHREPEVHVTGQFGHRVDPYATGTFPAQPRTDLSGYPARPAHLPFPGERREDESGERRDPGFGMTNPRGRRPQWADKDLTGTHTVLPGGASEADPRDETGPLTREFRVPEQDGPPVRRRIVQPPEDDEPRQG